MTTSSTHVVSVQRQPELLGQTVVIIGGSSGIGLETARRAHDSEGANIIITARDPDRLRVAAQDIGALQSAAFDANDAAALQRFMLELPKPIDHVMVTAGGPHYARLREMDIEDTVRNVGERLTMILEVARAAADTIRPGGSLVFVSGTGAAPGAWPHDRWLHDRRDANAHRQSGAGARACPRQRGGARLRRHPAVGNAIG